MASRRVYADPTAEKAARNLERWLKEKKARQAMQRRTSRDNRNTQQGERYV